MPSAPRSRSRAPRPPPPPPRSAPRPSRSRGASDPRVDFILAFGVWLLVLSAAGSVCDYLSIVLYIPTLPFALLRACAAAVGGAQRAADPPARAVRRPPRR